MLSRARDGGSLELRLKILGCMEPSKDEVVVETKRAICKAPGRHEGECGRCSAGGVLPFPKRSRRGVAEENDVGFFFVWRLGLRVRRGSLRTFTHPSASHFQRRPC
jgi:hypothetical protein